MTCVHVDHNALHLTRVHVNHNALHLTRAHVNQNALPLLTRVHVNHNAVHLTRAHINQNTPFKEGSNENCVLVHNTAGYCDISAEVGVLCERKQTPFLLYTHTHTHTQLSYENISRQMQMMHSGLFARTTTCGTVICTVPTVSTNTNNTTMIYFSGVYSGLDMNMTVLKNAWRYECTSNSP